MSSYFEIDGVIIECEDEESLPRIPNPLMGRWEVEEITRGELRDLEVDAKYEKEPAASESDLKQFSKFQMIGRGMAGAGAAILSVPDPLPLVDEVVGAGMVIVGTAMFYWG